MLRVVEQIIVSDLSPVVRDDSVRHALVGDEDEGEGDGNDGERDVAHEHQHVEVFEIALIPVLLSRLDPRKL